MAELNFEKLRAGTTKDNSDSGAQVAQKVNDNFDKVKAKVEEIEEKITTGTGAKIAINGTVLEADEEGVVNIPVVTKEQIGLVQSSEDEDFICAVEDGKMSVKALNVTKLVQGDEDLIILDGGDSNGMNLNP